MALSSYGGSSSSKDNQLIPEGKTEFEILRASHKFLREDGDDGKERTWDEQLAMKYYESLYREFAVCDLKHYKSGNFALRWRTESEVLSGAGETTCGNTRCEHHARPESEQPALTTLELPFAYVEHGEAKSALVKVVLCGRCVEKLMWKRKKDAKRTRAQEKGEEGEDEDSGKERGKGKERARDDGDTRDGERRREAQAEEEEDDERKKEHRRRRYRDGVSKDEDRDDIEGRRRHRRRSSRSRSPRREKSSRHD